MAFIGIGLRYRQLMGCYQPPSSIEFGQFLAWILASEGDFCYMGFVT